MALRSGACRKRLVLKLGEPIYTIDGPDDIRREWLAGADVVGLTAGASAPEILVRQVVARLMEWGAESVEENTGKPEQVTFGLPKNLVEALESRQGDHATSRSATKGSSGPMDSTSTP